MAEPVKRAAPAISTSVVSVCAVVLTSWSVTASVVRVLDDESARAAIEWGIREDPTPYFVENVSFPLGPREHGDVIAAIYTPYVRVATAAAAARQNGYRLDPRDVTAEMRAPVFYAVYRWPRKQDGPPTSPYVLGQQDHEAFLRQMRTAKPIWQTRDPGEWQDLIRVGVTMPFSDPVLVAAYPMTELVAGQHLVIYHDLDPDVIPGAIPASLIQIGWISEAHTQNWK